MNSFQSDRRKQKSERTDSRTQPAQLEQENQTGLPDALKAGVERLSGYSLNDIRVHYNSPKPAEVDALAYTQGTEIHIGPGQEQHLAHEAWHVVQQKEGRVQPTSETNGRPLNDEPHLETEADILGKQAAMNALQDGFTFPSLTPPTRKRPTSIAHGRIHQVLPEVQGVRLALGQPIENHMPIQGRWSVQILLSKDADKKKEIDSISVSGRTPSPYSGTMGAHSTAWEAHILALQADLKGQTISKALETMKGIIAKEKSSEALRFIDDLPTHHQKYLLDAMSDMDTAVAEADKADPEERALRVQEVMGAYFLFINYLPYATIYGSNTSGNAEGDWVGYLKEYESTGKITQPKQSKFGVITPLMCLWNLLDHKAVKAEALKDADELADAKESKGEDLTEKQQATLSEIKGRVGDYDVKGRYNEVWITRLQIHLEIVNRAFPNAVKDSKILTEAEVLAFLDQTVHMDGKSAKEIAQKVIGGASKRKTEAKPVDESESKKLKEESTTMETVTS